MRSTLGTEMAVTEGRAMRAKFVARVPDGTDSRIAWVLWMIGGIVFATAIGQLIIYIDVILEMVGLASWEGIAATIVTYAVEAAVAGAVVVAAGRFARRRLLMPGATWIAVAAVPLMMWVVVARDLVAGDYPQLVILAMPLTLALLGAWLVLRRDKAVSSDHAAPDGDAVARA